MDWTWGWASQAGGRKSPGRDDMELDAVVLRGHRVPLAGRAALALLRVLDRVAPAGRHRVDRDGTRAALGQRGSEIREIDRLALGGRERVLVRVADDVALLRRQRGLGDREAVGGIARQAEIADERLADDAAAELLPFERRGHHAQALAPRAGERRLA